MATFAFSDLHAQYDLWKQIKEYIKPEDTIYCLGDCVDRGDVGLEILNEVMETPNIILLRGNHEDFIDSIGSEVIFAVITKISLTVLALKLCTVNPMKMFIGKFLICPFGV